MMNLITRLRSMAAEQATYRRLRAEIAGLSHAEALDLGIFPGDADRIARQAVWGCPPSGANPPHSTLDRAPRGPFSC